MKPNTEQSEIMTFLAESNSKESLEARNNLLGFFEVLIEIDQRLKKPILAILEDKSNNEVKDT